jgi:flagellar hook-length control protein FliK
MQTQPVSVLPAVASGQSSSMEGTSALSAGDATDPNSFESMLDNQVQSLASEAGADPRVLSSQDHLVDAASSTTSSTATDSATPLDAAAVVSDLGALLASMLQATPAQAIATAGMAAEVGDGALPKIAEARVSSASGSALPIIAQDGKTVDAGPLNGKLAEEIAVSGKELPLTSGKQGSAALRSDEPVQALAALRSGEAVHVASVPHNGPESTLVRTDVAPQVSSVSTNHQSVASVGIEPRVGVPGWDAALGQKVVWLANQHQQSASMQLNPPNLGPLEVKLNISNDQASALFVSPHPAVRDAIETSLPRLREMLAENGISLGNVQVSAESFPREQGFDHRDGPVGRQSAGFGAATGVAVERNGVLHLPVRGLVDIYA